MTSSTRRMVERPVGSSGFGRVRRSTNGRCRSGSPFSLRGRVPKSRSISANEPYTSTRGCCGSSERHTGTGLPQNRLRVIDQSRAFSSHLPNWPCWMWSGVQEICSFSSTMRSLNFDTATNHDDTPM